jgi:methylmalonyl-CoA/ethylmalonyl-CoA epimerase
VQLRKIDHIAIAVRSLDTALRLYAEILGTSEWHIEEVPEQKTRVAVWALGEMRIELLEAMTEDSPVAGFLGRRGEGLHHICIEVQDLEGELRRLQAAGMRLIDVVPTTGAGGKRIAFLHPSSAAGVLIELCQAAPTTHTNIQSE